MYNNYIEIEEGDIFANFFQDSISEMGFVRKRPTVRVQLSLWQAFAKVPPDIVSPKCISQLHFNCISLSYFSSVFPTVQQQQQIWCGLGFGKSWRQLFEKILGNCLKEAMSQCGSKIWELVIELLSKAWKDSTETFWKLVKSTRAMINADECFLIWESVSAQTGVCV